MKTLGLPRNDSYRTITANSTPHLISKRQTCTQCRRNQSLWQFPINETVCISCNPKPVGWRRGEK